MVDLAERLGADRARHRPLRADRRRRRRARCSPPAADPAKDQSYMLAGAAARACWRRLRFPLGRADQARGARDRRRATASPSPRKPESQDLCFLAGQGKREFLRRHGGLARARAATIVDRARHARSAATAATTTSPSASAAASASPAPEPLYVLATDAAANTVTVGTARGARDRRRCASATRVLHRDGARVDAVRLRYHSRAAAGHGSARRRRPAATRRSRSSSARSSPAPAPGQIAVPAGGRDDRRPRHDRRA